MLNGIARSIVALFGVALLVIAPRVMARDARALTDYLHCNFDDGLEIVEIKQYPPGNPRYRYVTIDGKDYPVSLEDGYRVMFKYPEQEYFFANLKVERSRSDKFLHDQFVLSVWLDAVSAESPVAEQFKAFGGSYLGDNEIDKGGVIGAGVYVDTESGIIVSAYFLNQGETNRRFGNISEFETLRRRMLEKYASCVSSRNRRDR